MTQYTKLQNLFSDKAYSQIIDIGANQRITPFKDPQSSFIIAASYFMIGDFVNAEPLLEELFSVSSENPRYLSLYAATLRRLGDFHKSRELSRKHYFWTPVLLISKITMQIC